jgi:hypothetical protein
LLVNMLRQKMVRPYEMFDQFKKWMKKIKQKEKILNA